MTRAALVYVTYTIDKCAHMREMECTSVRTRLQVGMRKG